MYRIAFELSEQARGFMECQEPPVTEAEVLECFSSNFKIRDTSNSNLQCHAGRTLSGRRLDIYYKFIYWTNEIVVHGVNQIAKGSRGSLLDHPVNLNFED